MKATQITPDPSRDQIVAAIRAADALVNAAAQYGGPGAVSLLEAAHTARRVAWGVLHHWDNATYTPPDRPSTINGPEPGGRRL